ncbi:TonB family protein [Kangiella sp. TOML190]|uniref:TonB family protein n=1 Tax=Kangiella sp. TOML190 TaxID=2931351 RepID=UPI00203E0B62|nr:TonB family protein [Kangiella sp. TOML190]
MNDLLQTLWQSNLELSLLLLAILTARYLIRKTTKNYNAYLLWLSIPVGLLLAGFFSIVNFGQEPTAAMTYIVQAYIVRPAETFDSWLLVGYLWALVSLVLLVRLCWQHKKLRQELKYIKAPLNLTIASSYPIVGIAKEDFSPAVYGFFKPTIYFPVHLKQELSAEQITLIVRHEEHHIKQKHLWLNLLWDILVCISWFNPLVYISRQSFRHDQELFCDYLVLNRSNADDHQSYGHALLTTISATHSVSLLCSWKMFNQLEERIMNLKKPTSLSSKLSLAIGGLAIIGCTSLYAISMSQYSQQHSQESQHESLSVSNNDGDSTVEWNIGGKTYVDNKGDWYILEEGRKRQMTSTERRDFEKAVERAEKEMQLSEEEMRKAEAQIRNNQRQMEKAVEEIENAQHELALSYESMQAAFRDIEQSHMDMEIGYMEGRLSAEEVNKIREELQRAREQLMQNKEQHQQEFERARQQLEKAQQEMINNRSKRQPPIAPAKPEAPEKPTAAVAPNTTKPAVPAEINKPVAPQAIPLATYPPEYPKDAIENNVQGFVEYQFDLDANGYPSNFKLLRSEPEGVFDDAAYAALQKWRFDANGLRDSLRYKLEFRLEP